MIEPPKENKTPDLKRIASLNWKSGWVSNEGQLETPKDGLFVAENVVMSSAGSIQSRPNFNTSEVPDIPGSSFKGPLFSFWNTVTSTYDLICVANGKLHMWEYGSDSWKKVDEPDGDVNFATEQLTSYAQYGNLVCIADGENAIAYFSCPSSTTLPFVSRPGEEVSTNPGMIVTSLPLSYGVTYDSNGATGGATSDPTKYFPGSTVKTVANGFSEEGYDFVGWSIKADSENVFNPGDTFTMPEYDVTLYAQWIAAGESPGTRQKPTVEDKSMVADYRAYYMVSYVNDWGETIGSGGSSFETAPQYADVVLLDSNNPLGTWKNEIRVDVTAVNTALTHNARVRIYRALTTDYLTPSVNNYSLVKEFPVSEGPQSFVDDGSFEGLLKAPQRENSTGGLPARWVWEIDGRMWAFGRGEDRQNIYYSGAAPTDSDYPQFFTGEGGHFYVAYGTSFSPVTIRRGRADDGEICNYALCSGPNGEGRRFNIKSLSTTYGDTEIFQFYPSEQHGDEGAYSTFGVLDYMNSILYPSPGGFKSSGVRAQYTGDNITASIDSAIHDYVSGLSYSTFESMYGTMYDHKAIWHTGPASMIVFDARLGGAWTYWTMSHDWFGSLSIGDQRAALYLVSGQKVLRYADRTEFASRDAVGPENKVKIASGRLFADPEDGRQWIHLIQVLFVFSELKGPVRIDLRANSTKRLEVYSGNVSIVQDIFGGEDVRGSNPVEYSWKKKEYRLKNEKGDYNSLSVYTDGPISVSLRNTAGLAEVRIKVKKNVNYLDWSIESLDGFLGLKLEEFIYEFVDIGPGLDFGSRYNQTTLKAVRNP